MILVFTIMTGDETSDRVNPIIGTMVQSDICDMAIDDLLDNDGLKSAAESIVDNYLYAMSRIE